MPYPYIKNLPLWPSHCGIMTIREDYCLKTSNTENCFLQIISGRMVIQHKSRRHTLAARSVVALGRNTSVLLEPQAQQSCQLILLFLHHAPAAPNINLNFLCLHVSLVDVFFGRKTRFCILTDQEHIYVTFHAILYEWEHDQPERDTMLTSLLQEFFIRLARSFHAHNRPTGIQYLTSACDYIKQNFQEPLTLEKIAAHVGISRSYLAQLFSTQLNRSVVEYIQTVRCDHAAYLLNTTSLPIIDIAMETGFNNRQHFTRTFGKLYGMPPHEYRHVNHVSYVKTPGLRNGPSSGSGESGVST